jgi:hypothetical protein
MFVCIILITRYYDKNLQKNKRVQCIIKLTKELMTDSFDNSAESGDVSEDEDYSASVSAIMQRRASTRRSKRSRRPSSPFSSEARRRSSVFTTSSGEYENLIE